MNAPNPAHLLLREEVLQTLTELGEDPQGVRVDAVHALIDASSVPVDGRDAAVRAAVVAARRQLDGIGGRTPDLAPQPQVADGLRDYLQTPELVDGWITLDAVALKDGAVKYTKYFRTPNGGLLLRSGLDADEPESPQGLVRRFEAGERIVPVTRPQVIDLEHRVREAEAELSDAQDAWDLTHSEDQHAYDRLEAARDAAREANEQLAQHNSFDSPTPAAPRGGVTGNLAERSFSFRAESDIDVERFRAACDEHGVSVIQKELRELSTVTRDVAVELVTTATIDRLRAVLAQVDDAHVMLRTLREGRLDDISLQRDVGRGTADASPGDADRELPGPIQDELLELGVAVYQVGDVYETDSKGNRIPDERKAKWFVSVLASSSLAGMGGRIPLADTENGAWQLAAQHFGKLPKLATEQIEPHAGEGRERVDGNIVPVSRDMLRWLLEQAQELKAMKVEINGDYTASDLAEWDAKLADVERLLPASDTRALQPQAEAEEGREIPSPGI